MTTTGVTTGVTAAGTTVPSGTGTGGGTGAAVATVTRPRLVSRALVLVFVADFAGLTSFYLLLSVVPQYAAAAGAGTAAAGLTTAVLMASTVAAELVMPRLVATFGHRAVLAAGLLLLGAPALLLPLTTSTLAITAVCLLRGVGLAVIFVVCGELGAALVPVERRGEGIGLLGVVAGVPAVLALPLSVWLTSTLGFGPVLLAGAITALAGVAAVCLLPRHLVPAHSHTHGDVDSGTSYGVLATLRTPGILLPALVFAATAVGAGAILTFLPVAARPGSGALVATALLATTLAATGSRWFAGRYSDNQADSHGGARLLRLAAIAAAAGTLSLVLIDTPAAVLIGATLFGIGFGAAQNASLTAMYDTVSIRAFGAVTALWSVAYDAGLGLGAAGYGLLAHHTGYQAAFAVTAVAIAATIPLCRRRPQPPIATTTRQSSAGVRHSDLT
jgi:predicted MFS family arabinose efflux permease